MIGDNIRKIRKAKGLTILEVATIIGSDVGNLSRLERNRQGYSDDLLRRLAAALEVPVSDFFDGPSQSNVEPGPDIKGLVPVISWIQAGDFCEAVDLLPPGEAEEWISCPVSHSPHTYALRVRGASMEPRFREGEIVIVDPKIGADNGRFVIAKKTGANEVTLKKLVIEGDDRYLQAVNPAWPEPIIRIAEEWIICGVVICKMEIL